MSEESMSEKSTIQVGIKLCPLKPGHSSLWQVKGDRSIQLAGSLLEASDFDYVFDEDSGNRKVFDCMGKHIVRACVQGFNGTIFAYGQESSGKTYIMLGDGQNPGIILLSARYIFDQIANVTDRRFVLRASYIEICNEKVNDLLNNQYQNLELHEAPNGIVKVDSEEAIIIDEDDIMNVIDLGKKERSSDSHAIFRISIESWHPDRSDSLLQSTLTLVDLAGTDRQSGNSLSFLSTVVESLSCGNAKPDDIGFTDCKLLRFLKASLCGHGFTSIICTIRPWILEESESTLKFAMRARKIRIKKLMEKLEREIEEPTQVETKELDNTTTLWQPALLNRRCISFPDIFTEKGKAIFVELLEDCSLSHPNGKDSNNNMVEQFVKLSETIHNVTGRIRTGLSRLTASKQSGSLKEYEKKIIELSELVEKKKNELVLKDKQRSDEINALHIEYLQKMITIENENRAKFDLYTQEKQEKLEKRETQESKELVTDSLKADMMELQVMLKSIIEKNMEQLKAQHQVELEQCKKTLKDSLLQAAEYEKLKDYDHLTELDEQRAHLEAEIIQAKHDQIKALKEVTSMQTFHDEYVNSSDAILIELQEEYDQLKEENSKLLIEIDDVHSKHFNLVKMFNKLEVEMVEVSKKKYAFEDQLKAMTYHMNVLVKELTTARLKAASHDDLILEHAALKFSLSKAMKVPSTLQAKVDMLQFQLLASEKEISNRDLEIEKINVGLKNAKEANDVVSANLLAITAQKVAVEQEMARKDSKIATKFSAINGFIDDLEAKLRSQQGLNNALKLSNDELRVQLRKAYNILSDQSVELEDLKAQLKYFNQKCLKLKQNVKDSDHAIEQLTKECNHLHDDLETETKRFQKEKEVLDKQLLEERDMSSSLYKRNADLMSKLKANATESESLRQALINQKIAYDKTEAKYRQEIEQLKAKILTQNEEKQNVKNEQGSLYEKNEKLSPALRLKNQMAAYFEFGKQKELKDQNGSKAELGHSKEQ